MLHTYIEINACRATFLRDVKHKFVSRFSILIFDYPQTQVVVWLILQKIGRENN